MQVIEPFDEQEVGDLFDYERGFDTPPDQKAFQI